MRLTKTQLDILRIAYMKPSISSREAANQLKHSQEYISKLTADLKQKGFLKKEGVRYSISDNIYSYDLKNLFLEHPKTNFNEILADSRMDILLLLFDKRTTKRIQYLSGLSKPLIYKYIKDFLKYGIIIKIGKYYKLNGFLWSELVDFLDSYSKYQHILSYNLPSVYRQVYKSKNLQVFEVPLSIKVDEKIATKTAFSLFTNYGISLRLVCDYYCTPVRSLNINDIFAHAILCSRDIRKKTFSILFYIKNKKLLDIESINRKYKLSGDINKIKTILKGETLKDYPTLEEIKQKAELYDIKY